MKNQAFHEWVKVEDVSDALPTFTTSDIGHFFIVGDLDGGEEGAEGGPYLPGMGGLGAGPRTDYADGLASRQSLEKLTNRKADYRR